MPVLNAGSAWPPEWCWRPGPYGPLRPQMGDPPSVMPSPPMQGMLVRAEDATSAWGASQPSCGQSINTFPLLMWLFGIKLGGQLRNLRSARACRRKRMMKQVGTRIKLDTFRLMLACGVFTVQFYTIRQLMINSYWPFDPSNKFAGISSIVIMVLHRKEEDSRNESGHSRIGRYYIIWWDELFVKSPAVWELSQWDQWAPSTTWDIVRWDGFTW